MQGVPDHNRLVSGEVIPGAKDVQAARPDVADPVLAVKAFSAADEESRMPERRKAGPLLFWSTCLLAAFLVFWIAGGHRLVLDPLAKTIRDAPAQALQIEDVTSRIDRREGSTYLLVDGAVRNRGSQALPLPPLVIAVSEVDGPTVRYYLGTNDSALEAGEAYAFSSRLDAPQNGVAAVSITFQEGSR